QDVDTRGGLEFDLLDLAIEAACAGLGVTDADRSMVRNQLETGQLVQLFDVEVEGHESYWFVTRPQAGNDRKVDAFRAWLLAEVSADSAA
ncbi:MAG: LysR family transcriptional regulator, partial [Ensifer adhaerens]|nr:LysR family transcriptional regulator [Ensifer adhaerens]